jgi:hypothetical protein
MTTWNTLINNNPNDRPNSEPPVNNGAGDGSLWSGAGMIAANQALVSNDAFFTSRAEFFRRIFDPRRDIYEECGYPKGFIVPQLYQDLYDRSAIAARVVEVITKRCWRTQPTVYEDEDAQDKTAFEQAWDELGARINTAASWYKDEEHSPIWEYLQRVDVLAGIGQYGVIFLGIDDGLDLNMPADTITETGSIPSTTISTPDNPQSTDPLRQDVPYATAGVTAPSYGSSSAWQGFAAINADGSYPAYTLTENKNAPKRNLLYIRCYAEVQARVVAYEANRRSPRFGQPVMYAITFQDPNNYPMGGGVAIGYTPTTLNVHWTRVLHVVDNYHQATSSEIAGAPRMRAVLNHILALEKIYGASGEGYWTSALPKTIVETHPQLGGDVLIDKSDMRNQLENLHNSTQKYLILMGMSAKTLPPHIVDPKAFADIQMQAITIKIGMPMRVFMGSERGELSSGQDDEDDNDNIKGRNTQWTIPKLVVAFVNRLIQLGCLPVPKQFCVHWADQRVMSPQDKAVVAFQTTQSINMYVTGNLSTFISPLDYMVEVLGYDEETAEMLVSNAEEHQEEVAGDAQDLADEHGFVPTPPKGYRDDPQPEPPGTPAGKGTKPVGSGGVPGGKPSVPRAGTGNGNG